MKSCTKIIIVVAYFLTSTFIYSHEIFSPRADLARQGGVNIDNALRYSRAGNQYEAIYYHRIMYGLSEYLTLEMRIPIVLQKKVSEFTNGGLHKFVSSTTSGPGKIEISSKFRIFHDYGLQRRNQIVLLLGFLTPTAPNTKSTINKKPIIGTRSLDFTLGIAGAFETTKIYHFASLRYRINTTSDQLQEGNKLFYSYAFGYRPKKPEIDKVDWVFLIDIDGIWSDKDKIGKCVYQNTGGTTLFIGPSFFRSKDNVMIKGGIQFPLLEHLNGIQERSDFRAMLGVFIQF